MSAQRVVIAGGGTGGHLFPGLAVAEELRAQGAAVDFIGTERGIEARVVPQQGYPLHLIHISGLKRVGLAAGLRGALRLPSAALETLQLLRRLRPQVIVGVGGYASGPVVLLGALLQIPTVVLEQNSVPGVTNRLLARACRRLCLAFPDAAAAFPRSAQGKIQVLGNPIRAALLQVQRRPRVAGEPPRLLVLGGSQGAHAVNELVAAAVELLVGRGGPLPRLVHQTGRADEEAVRARYQRLGLRSEQAQVRPFIEDMGAAYAEADLVLGRAGATTLAELCALGLPAVLIPFPGAADDHQTKNAEFLAREGAARILPQAESDGARLAAELRALTGDEDALARMAAASRRLGRPDAAAAVARLIHGLA